MELNQIFSQIDALYEEFKANHIKHTTKGNKAAGARSRKAIGEIKKLITSYRKASIDADKTK